MANQLGRISGQLLKDNLTRNDDLQFDTDLLYLNTGSRYISVNSSTTSKPLFVNGTLKTTDFIAPAGITGLASFDFDIANNTITAPDNINLSASNYVYADRLQTSQLEFYNNVIQSLNTNTNIDLSPSGSGTAEVFSNLNISGDLTATGNITLDGTITFGSDNNDSLTFAADINSDIIPNVNAPAVDYPSAITATWPTVRFKYDVTGYTNLFLFWYIANTPWNLWVDANVHVGNHVYATRNGVRRYYGTVTAKPVIAGISAGDQITFTVSNPENHPAYFDYPDPIYATTFEISAVPDGVRGFSLGSNPTTGRWKEIHPSLINGQLITGLSIVSGGLDLVLRPGNIWYVAANGSDSNVGDHQSSPFATIGHALTVATASDTVYIYPGTYNEFFPLTVPTGVAVKGTSIRSVTVVPDSTTQSETAFLLNGETTVSDLTVKDFYAPGYAFAFAPGFTVSSRSPYVQNITVLTKGTTISISDPRGFDSGDAGGGARVDGSLATSASKEASMLFHSVTFITPGVDALVMTNGVRVEWLNSFTYFANKGLYATSGTLGFANQSATAQVITGGTPGETWAAPRTLTPTGSSNGKSVYTYYDETLLWTGTYWKYWNSTIGSGVWYQSTDDTAYPWQATNWTAVGAALPVPTFGTSLKFGAELRSIGSANVYGNYGAYAAGAGTLMYLVQHNFAYIGAGKDVTNDPSLNIAANETVELAAGKIYYQSLDNKGNFKVGDAFGVSFDTGLVAINGVSVSAGGVTSINFLSGTDETVIDATQINVNNIKFSGNTLSSLSGNVELTSGTNEFNIPIDVATTDNVDIIGDFTIDGQLTIGNQFIDVIEFVAPLDYELRPNLHNSYSLGKFDKQWATTTVSESYIGNLRIQNNIISTLDSNANLELLANGIGEIVISNTDAVFDQNLTVSSDTFLKDTNITGLFNYLGNLDQTGNTLQTGNRYITGNLTVIGDIDFGEIEIKGNTVATSTSNSNLELKTSGSGEVYVPSNDVQIDNDLIINGLTTAASVGVTTAATSQTYSNSNISVGTNIIETTISNSDLELRVAGTGRVYVPNSDVKINNNLTISGTASFAETSITGLLTHLGTVARTGSTTQTGNTSIAGQLTVIGDIDFGDVEVVGNTISTSTSNSDLELTTSGNGEIYIPSNNVQINNNLTVNGLTTATSIVVTSLTTTQTYSNSNIFISTNVIETTASNSDLELRAAGTGRIYIPQDDVKINNDLTVDGLTTTKSIDITGLVNQTGNTVQTGNTLQTGNRTIAGRLTVNSNIDFGNITIAGNTVTTSESNSNLELKTSGSGEVYVPSNDVQIDNDLVVGGLTSSNSLTSTTSTTSQTYSNSNISIGTNIIETTVSNSDLELRAAGTGRVYIPQDNVKIDNALTVDGTTTLANISITGLITHIGNTNQTGNILQTGNKTIIGRLTVTDNIDFGEVEIKGNTISTSTSNSNLELTTSGSGEIYVPSNDVQIDNDLVVGGLTSSNSLTSTTSTTSQTYSNNNISIGTNVIETTISNSDLELRTAGTGRVYVPQDNVKIDNDLTVDGTTNLAITNITGTITHVGNTSQTGSSTQTGNRTITGILTVIGDVDFGDVEFKGNTITTTRSNSNLELSTSGSGEVIFNDAVLLNQSANITTLVTNGIGNSGTITSEIFTNTNIEIQDNNIKTTSLNSDLILSANNTGIISFPLDPVVIGQDFTVTLSSTLKNTTIVGPLTHAGLTTQVGANAQTGILDITGNLTVTADAYLENVNIINNRITTVASNSNLELKAVGSGIVRINDSATFGQQLTVNGVTTTNSITSTGTITANQFKNDDILIDDNYIATTNSNSNLVLNGDGTGGAKLEKIKFNSSTISTDTVNEGITLSIPSNSLTLNAATALKVPVGTTVNRSTLTQGEFRFNTTDSLFRGFSSSKVSFAGVYSENLQTNVLAHPTNNTLLFTANSILAGTISSTGLVTNGLLVDNNLFFNNNTISSTTANSDIVLLASGTGHVKIDDIAIEDNEFLNLNSTQPILLENTGSGYVKFAGTAGLRIPAGNNDSRPPNPETGDLRWNTQISTAEVFNGIEYQTLSGGGGDLLSAAEIQEVTNLWALVLG